MMTIVRRKTEEAYAVQHQIGLAGLIKGQVGLEIEVEGNKFPKPPGMEGTHTPVPMTDWPRWSYVHDGSLRGRDNAEYILTNPLPFSEVNDAVDELFVRLNKYGSKIDDSNRTSVHVHLNVRDFFLNRLTSLMALWIIFEGPLTEWCGDHRVGNLFCLGAKDAPATVSHLRRFIKSNMIYGLREGLHYSGMNAHAVVQKGSLEFRTLEGTRDPERIKNWVRILKRLYDLSAEYPDPRQIVEGFSGRGPSAFFDGMLGDTAQLVRRGIEMDEERLRACLYESVRLSQDLAYAKDWAKYKPIEVKIDVFGRTKGKTKRFATEVEIDIALAQPGAMEATENMDDVEFNTWVLNNLPDGEPEGDTETEAAGVQLAGLPPGAQFFTPDDPQWTATNTNNIWWNGGAA